MKPNNRICRDFGLIALTFSALAVHSARAANIWDGGGADNNWNTANNWDINAVPTFPVGLTFTGTTRTTSNNDIAALTVNGFTFNSGAAAFTVTGNAISLGGNITNNSNVTQTINLDLALTAARTITLNSGFGGSIALGGNISGGFGLTLGSNSNLEDSAYFAQDFVTLSGFTSSYSGGTTLNQGGRLAIGSNSALGSGTLTLGNNRNVIKAMGGARTISNAVQIGGTTTAVTPFIGGSDSLTFNGTFTGNDASTTVYIVNTATTTFAGGIAICNAATNRTFTLAGTSQNTIISSVVSNGGTATAGNLAVGALGLGTSVTMNGAAVNTYAGSTTVNTGSKLTLDFANLATPTNLVNSASALTLNGGRLTVKGKASAATSQTMGALTLSANGGSIITVDANGNGGTTLTTAGWTRNGNSALNVILTGTGAALTSSAAPGVTNGILTTAYATVTDGTGTGFATVSGSNIVRYTGATALADTSNDGTVNLGYTADGTTFNWNNGITARSANSLAIDTSANSGTLDLGATTNVLTLTSKGLLMTGANGFTIQNGQVGANATETIIHQMGGGTLTINGTVGSGGGSLTKNGTGTLILGGANTYTGATVVDQGTLSVTGSLGTSALTVSNGTFAISGTTTSTAATINGGGTLQLANTGALATTASIGLNSGGTLDLRADTDSTFTIGALNNLTTTNGNSTINVGAATSATNKVITLSTTNGLNFANATGSVVLNVTGGNGYTLATGPAFLGNANSNPTFTYNVAASTTLKVGTGVAGQSFSNNGQQTNLYFRGAGDTIVTGNITEAGGNTSRVINVSVNGPGAVTLQGLATADTGALLGTATASGLFNFYLNSGTLNVNNAGALKAITASTGNLYLLGGTLDNTTASAITLSQNLNATNIFGDFAYGGTKALNLAAGGVTLGGTGASRTITVNGTSANGLTLGGVVSQAAATSYGITKAGNGTLTFSGANTYSGTTTISAGTLAINGDQSAATGVVSVSNAGTRLIGTGTVGGDTTINTGAIQSAGGAIANVDKVGKQIFDAAGAPTTNVTYAAGSIFEWDLSANKSTAGYDDDSNGGTPNINVGTRGTHFDAVDLSGTLTVDSTDVTGTIFRVVLGSGVSADPFWQQTQTWTDIFGGGYTLSGTGFNSSLLEVVDTSGNIYNQSTLNPGYRFSVSGTTLSWSAVPEPTSGLSGLLIGAAFLRRRRN